MRPVLGGAIPRVGDYCWAQPLQTAPHTRAGTASAALGGLHSEEEICLESFVCLPALLPVSCGQPLRLGYSHILAQNMGKEIGLNPIR